MLKDTIKEPETPNRSTRDDPGEKIEIKTEEIKKSSSSRVRCFNNFDYYFKSIHFFYITIN